jgi:hypothetical protein
MVVPVDGGVVCPVLEDPDKIGANVIGLVLGVGAFVKVGNVVATIHTPT